MTGTSESDVYMFSGVVCSCLVLIRSNKYENPFGCNILLKTIFVIFFHVDLF